MTDLIAQPPAAQPVATGYRGMSFVDAKKAIMDLPVDALRGLAISQLIQLQIGDEYSQPDPRIAELEGLPEVAYYVYEWDTASGVHRDTSPNPWNGMPPTRSVPIYAKPDPRIAELEALLLDILSEAQFPGSLVSMSNVMKERIAAALNREG